MNNRFKRKVSNEKYNSEISFKLFETIVDPNAFQQKEKRSENVFSEEAFNF